MPGRARWAGRWCSARAWWATWACSRPTAGTGCGCGGGSSTPGRTTRAAKAPTSGPQVREWITLGTNVSSQANVSYLPLPYAARQVKVNGSSDWRIDGNALSVLSASAKLAGLHYQVLAKDVNPLPEQLRRLPK